MQYFLEKSVSDEKSNKRKIAQKNRRILYPPKTPAYFLNTKRKKLHRKEQRLNVGRK